MAGAQREARARTRYKLPADPYSSVDPDEAPPTRGRRPLIVAGCLVALVAAVFLAGRIGHHGSTPSNNGANGTDGQTGASGQTADSTVGSTTGVPAGAKSVTIDGLTIPVGYPDNGGGAQSAAANYVVAYGSTQMVEPSVRDAIMGDIGDPAVLPGLESQLDSAFSFLAKGMGLTSQGVAPAGETLVFRNIPVGVSTVSLTATKAVVAVWTDGYGGLIGASSQYPVTQNWSTITVTLDWAHGDWKWAGFTSVSGPTPNQGEQTPSTNQQLQQANSQFGGLPYAG